MNQQGFQERYHKRWAHVAQQLDSLDRRQPILGGESFPEQYRQVCLHLALARYRKFSADVIEGLNRTALRGHQHLYTGRAKAFKAAVDFIAFTFPQTVRAEWKLLLLSCLLFFGTGIASYVAIRLDPDLAYTIIGPGQAAMMEFMYDPSSDHFLRERPADSDIFMFGFYIRNNIGIGFQTFGSGIFLGLGSAIALFYNGLILGGAAGHIDNVGFSQPFYSFVIGHGSFELVAIALAGVSGMKLGVTVIAPGRRSRKRALVEEGKKAATLIYGFAGMLLIAAFLEAFWSSSHSMPVSIKYGVGAFFWALVVGYFLFAGRGRAAR